MSRLIPLLCLALWAAPAAGTALQDPTLPPVMAVASVVAAPTEVPHSLTSIVSVSGKRSAVIDGQRVQEGDEIGGFRVVRIRRIAVELEGPESPVTLVLFGRPVKAPAEKGR